MRSASNKKIKIMLVIDSFETGGAQQILYDTVRYSDSEKFEYCVVSLKGGGPYFERFCQLGVKVHTLKLKKFDPRVKKAIEPLLRSFAPDIIHLNLFKSIIQVKTIKKLFNVKVIITDHSRTYDPNILKVYFPGRLASQMFLWLYKRQLPYIDMMALLTNEDKTNYSKKFNLKPEMSVIIPNAVDFEFIEGCLKDQEVFRKNFIQKYAFSKLENHIVIGFLGRLSGEKGCFRFLDVIKYLNENSVPVQGLMAGDGPERKNIEKYIINRSLENKVHLTGYIPQEDITGLFGNIDLFWLPSATEAFGIVLIEAMAHKIPTVSIKSGGPAEIIDDKINGILVEEPTGEALAKKSLQLINDPTLYESIANAGQEKVKSRFDIRIYVSRYEEIYSQVNQKEAN